MKFFKFYALSLTLALAANTAGSAELKVYPVPPPASAASSASAPASEDAAAQISTHDKKYAQEYTAYAKSLSTVVELQYRCSSLDASKKRFQKYLKDLTEHLSGQNIGFSSYQFKADLQEGAANYGAKFEEFSDAAKVEVCKKFVDTIEAAMLDFEKSLAKQKDSVLPYYTN